MDFNVMWPSKCKTDIKNEFSDPQNPRDVNIIPLNKQGQRNMNNFGKIKGGHLEKCQILTNSHGPILLNFLMLHHGTIPDTMI